MTKRPYSPIYFSAEEAVWYATCLLSLVGGLSAMIWLSHAVPIEDPTAKTAWKSYQMEPLEPFNVRRHVKAAMMTQEVQTIDHLAALLDQATTGRVSSDMLLNAYFSQEQDLGGGQSTQLQAEFEHLIQGPREPTDPISQLARLKAQMLANPKLVYVSSATTLSDVLLYQQIQCQSSSVAIVLAWLQQTVTQERNGPRPVFVQSPGHVQPGLLYQNQLHLMEATSRGDRVAVLPLEALKEAIVLDGSDALTWSLLRDQTPDTIVNRMVLYESNENQTQHDYLVKVRPRLALPPGINSPIITDMGRQELSDHVDPVDMLSSGGVMTKATMTTTMLSVPEPFRSPEPRLKAAPMLTEPATSIPMDTPDVSAQWLENLTEETKPSFPANDPCHCLSPMQRAQLPEPDPCNGQRRTPLGELCPEEWNQMPPLDDDPKNSHVSILLDLRQDRAAE